MNNLLSIDSQSHGCHTQYQNSNSKVASGERWYTSSNCVVLHYMYIAEPTEYFRNVCKNKLAKLKRWGKLWLKNVWSQKSSVHNNFGGHHVVHHVCSIKLIFLSSGLLLFHEGQAESHQRQESGSGWRKISQQFFSRERNILSLPVPTIMSLKIWPF